MAEPLRGRCPKVGLLGDRCTQERSHPGRHTFPPNPDKTPGVRPTDQHAETKR